LEVPDVDVADVYLAGGSEFGHGVAGAQGTRFNVFCRAI
jgi:hypothetical protein